MTNEPRETRVATNDGGAVQIKTPNSGEENEPPRGKAPLRKPTVRLGETNQRPALHLFDQEDAGTRARELGAPWVPVAYACGYLLTDGWSFRDAAGIVQSFCLVPVDALPMIRALVTELPTLNIPARQWPRVIHENLRDEPGLLDLSQPLFEAVCRCTLMRTGHRPPAGERSDWLTDPPWALKLPKRRRAIIVRTKP